MKSDSDVEQAWQKLAERADLIGKEVVFDNRVGECEDRGKISKIRLENGYVTIESPEIAAAHAADKAWSPVIRFQIGVDRGPQVIGDTIFCDLDEHRQIRISLN